LVLANNIQVNTVLTCLFLFGAGFIMQKINTRYF
jgi:hypothetical protein